MKINLTTELFDYCVGIRRELHRFPEVGFDLNNTVAVVCRELDNAGIPYTTKYGKGSVVAEIGKGEEILALRADMDALPVHEKTGLPFASVREGYMHACGHDSHTAILLTVAKLVKENEDKLNKKIRFIFQPSEECAESGAKMLVENGVLNGVSEILAAHCENELNVGLIGLKSGDYMAACAPLKLRFYGVTSHATIPKGGVDAIAMANRAYNTLKDEVKILAQDKPYIWSVGKISGGTAHNIIADFCEMDISFRFYNGDFAESVHKKIDEVCALICREFGGRYELDWLISSFAVINDNEVCERFKKAVTTKEIAKKLSSEDFGWYLTKVKGALFRFGTKSEEKGCVAPLHRNDFTIDEDGFKTAIDAFCSYIFFESSDK